MATFTQIGTLTRNVVEYAKVATDGTYIYYWDTSFGIYRIDLSVPSDTQIIANASLTGLSSARQMLCFDQQIFISGTTTTANQMRVWRWDGGSVSTDLTITGCSNIWMTASPYAIVVHGPGTSGGGWVQTGKYKTSAGGSWSDAGYPSGHSTHVLNFADTPSLDYREFGDYVVANIHASSPSSGDGPYVIMQFVAGSSWQMIKINYAYEGGLGVLHGVGPTTFFDPIQLEQTAGYGKFVDSSFSTHTSIGGESTQQMAILNMPAWMGHKYANYGGGFKQWTHDFNGTDMNTYDSATDAFAHDSTGNDVPWAIRTDDGEVYYIMKVTTNDWRLYQRSTPLSATPNSWAVQTPPLTPVNNLWVYKTEDRGLTWESKAVYT